MAIDNIWASFDLTPVRERFRLKHEQGTFADELDLETRRFLFLVAQNPDLVLAPSDLVDEYWHSLILNTALYKDYCDQAFGKFIDHVAGIPSASPERHAAHTANYLRTQEAYAVVFGQPDKRFWPPSDSEVTRAHQHYANPHRIHLEVTNHCNLNCEHCYPESTHTNPHHELSTIVNVLNVAKANKVGKVTLTGGELLTRDDWKAVVLKALDTADNLYFITNGVLLSEDKLQWLAEQKVKRALRHPIKTFINRKPVQIGLAISLDGLKGNELVRKNAKGVPVKAEQIIEKIRLAKNYGLHLTVNTTIANSITAKELPEMYDLLTEIGIDRWQIDVANWAGRMHNSNLKLSGLQWLEDAKPSYRYIVEKYLSSLPIIPDWRLEVVGVFRYDMLFQDWTAAKSIHEHPCNYQFGSVIVEGGDEVRFCPSLRGESIGSLSKGNLQSVYKEDKFFNEFLQKSISDLPCKDCRYGLAMHGGCRAHALGFHGEAWATDPVCCSLSPFVEDEIIPLFPEKFQKSFKSSLQTNKPKPGDETHGGTKTKRRIIPISPAVIN